MADILASQCINLCQLAGFLQDWNYLARFLQGLSEDVLLTGIEKLCTSGQARSFHRRNQLEWK